MDNYGTCVKNQLDQAMMSLVDLVVALNICASLRQALPFYLFIEKEQFSSANLRGANSSY